MSKRPAALADLHYDILKEILIRVARSSEGAQNFAKAISVCKAFRQFIEDGDVLRDVAFDDLSMDGHWELFQLTGGLICRCAQAGQEQAQFLLGKIILVSTSQLVITKKHAIEKGKASSSSSAQAKDVSLQRKITQLSSFLESFLPHRTCPNFIGSHINFVKIFITLARLSDFEEMEQCLKIYMIYFMSRGEHDIPQLINFFEQFFHFFKMVCSFEEELEPETHTFSGMVRDLCLVSSQTLQRLGLKKEQLGRIELRLDGVCDDCVHSKYSMTLVAKLDMLLKRLRALEVDIKEFDKASQHSSQKDADLAHILLSSLLPAFEQLPAVMDNVQKLKATALCYQEARSVLISRFHDLFPQANKR